ESYDYYLQDGQIVYTENGKAHAKDHGAPIPISSAFDMTQLGSMNPGFLESLAVGKRADVYVAPMGFANGKIDARAYYDVMAIWMTDCIMGKISADAGIKGAADELRAKKIID
ncbi:MAG: hypothetical protein Q8M76_09050, partial [Spirochaetaceae bacterium]|nr:hypothetical protein [Spirochaetaceae bacterium]